MKKILVIAGDDEIRKVVSEVLGLSNYWVVAASSAKEGIPLALKEQPSLILCDINLSSLNGYGVMHALQQFSATRTIPVIAFTSTEDPADFRKVMSAGADDYLTMPFDATGLLRSVEACLERNQRRMSYDPEGRASQERGTGQPPGSFRSSRSIPPSGTVGLPSNPGSEQGIPWQPGERDIRPAKKKEMLYSEGQRASSVFYLANGKVKTYLVHTDGKELITRIYGPGDCVGAAAVIRGGSYSDNAQVLEDAMITVISRSELLDILQSDSVFARQIIRWLAQNASEQEAGLLNLAYSSLRKKVANGIIGLYDKFSRGQTGQGFLTISRENLAAFVGAAPESLTRTLSDFRKERLIEIAEGKIRLLDEEKLRKMLN